MATLTGNPVFNYIRESSQELRKVAWPSRKAVIRDTLLVVGVSLAITVFLGAIDFGLATGLDQLLTRVQ